MDRRRLRETFEEVPELYDRARPGYPEELFDDLVALAAIPAGGRMVEIGPGTGQATVPLARRGFSLVCVELGARLAEVARRNLTGFPNVEVVQAEFERWEPAEAGFDAVVSFTAFHWIDPEVRFEKSARLLRPGGALAVVETKHVRLERSDPFWVEVQADYDAVVPSDDNRPPPHPDEVGDLRAELEASRCFREVDVRRYVWEVPYTADEYVAVLDTYSGHRTTPEPQRRELYERIRRRIEARADPVVGKSYLATLNVGRV